MLAMALSPLGCDAPDPRPTGPELVRALGSNRAAMATLLGVDAGELEAPVDPPAPAGDLKTEIDRFTTLDACAMEHARLDPLLGDALEAVGYDTFLRDACRMIDAAKAGDASRCAAIDASSLEARCRATVAEVAGTPDECPWEATSRPARGRDPRCLAVASRDARLCAAVTDSTERATCEATLARSERPCASLRARSANLRCTRDAERWRNVLASSKAGPSGPPLAASGKLHIERRADAAEAVDVDLTPDVARGVAVLQGRDGSRFTLGPLTESGLDFIAPSPNVRASLALGILALAGAHGAAPIARVERAELVVPGRSPVSTPGAQSTLTATLDKLDAARASPVSIVVDGDMSAAGSSWRVHAEVTTFVRDVVRVSDLYGGRPGASDGGWR